MVSVFNTDPTKEYMEAVKALKALPSEQRSAAYAEAQAKDLVAAQSEYLGKRITRAESWKSLIGLEGDAEDKLPGDDHTSLWLGKGGLTYVSHPYDLRLRELTEIVDACEQHGLEVHIDARSWLNPGSTMRVCYTKAQNNRGRYDNEEAVEGVV